MTPPLPNGLSFIETQFPVAKLSKESYAERTAKQGQTLTGLGKWWGRKPLVLCRATLLGLLLPATDRPDLDREVFLRLMTMDDDGMLRRRSVNLPAKTLFPRLSTEDQARFFTVEPDGETIRFRRGVSKEEKEAVQRRVFLGLTYAERLVLSDRPEQVDGPSPASWAVINGHLGTAARSLAELVGELGQRRFGHVPRVGDVFSGGGSIPFEAARLGCDAYASDLNPVAAMLTWASLNIVGGGAAVAEEVKAAQREVYDAVDRQVTAWGIEHREPDPATGRRWRADAYLYCVEATCPECGWRVPLAPSWIIGKGTRTVARLVPDEAGKRFNFEVASDVSKSEIEAANEAGTAKDSEMACPHCAARTPMRSVRGDGRGSFGDSRSLLRGWENGDLVPREDDIFGERLYCVRWIDTWTETGRNGELQTYVDRHYLTPTKEDLHRESLVLGLLSERFSDWQKSGHLPSRIIESGRETSRPLRERGWTHWHHLYTPQQLLINGLFSETIARITVSHDTKIALTLGVGRCADWNSRLCRWIPDGAYEKSTQTFSNQTLNTLFNFGVRLVSALDTTWFARINQSEATGSAVVSVCDGRAVEAECDIWMTDPPYADAVSYEEVSELFLNWYAGRIPTLFPGWYADSKRALAVKGNDDGFRRAMVDCYRRMAEKMPDDGMQVVMFTHQDAGVWADLALILWAAGLRVCAAWCIATETTSELKTGNYVQGTVLLVLRKQAAGGGETAFLDEVYGEVETEVRRQLDSMRDLDDAGDPNFSDTDYQLAAYAAALRVLTSKNIAEIDVARELTRTRRKGEKSPVEELIERAVKIACDHLVPRGIETHLWRGLTALERLYLKGLEMESHGERRSGVYQELARGFGVGEYTPLLANAKANETRLKTATEFGRRDLGGVGFGLTLVRHALFATHATAEADGVPRNGITWLKTEVTDYAVNRGKLIEVLEFFATLRQNASLPHWHRDAEAAATLAGALRNRQDNV